MIYFLENIIVILNTILIKCGKMVISSGGKRIELTIRNQA